MTNLPVVDDSDLAGIVGLGDVIDFTTRDIERAKRGTPGFSEHGDESSRTGYRSPSGFGERGDTERLLNLPVRNVVTAPVATIEPSAGLSPPKDV